MASANITVLSPISGTNNTATWNYLPIRSGLLYNAIPALNRQVVLTPQGLLITGNGTQVGFLMTDLINAAVNIQPSMTTAPYVNQPPVNVLLNNAGSGSNFAVGVVSEITIISYQWQVSTNNGSTWNNLTDTGVYSGSATATLSISSGTGLETYQYRCVVTNALGYGISTGAIFSAITTQPSNASVTHPAAANFHVIASGASPLSYQWYFSSNSVPVNSFGVYSNTNTNHLNISNSTGLNGFEFYCVIKDPTGVANNSNNATLTVA